MYCIFFNYLRYFLVLATLNSAAMNIWAYESFWIIVFSGYGTSSGIEGTCGSSVFSF